jgi:hypothetical protein
MKTKLMTGVAAIALVLPVLFLDVTVADARGGRGGGHAVSHAAPARVSRPSVARTAAVRPSSNRGAAHAQLRGPLHTRTAAKPAGTGHTQTAHAAPARPVASPPRVGAQHGGTPVATAGTSASSHGVSTAKSDPARNLLLNRPGSGPTQPMHTASGNATPGRTTNSTVPADKSGSHLPPFQAGSKTAAGGTNVAGTNPSVPHPATHGGTPNAGAGTSNNANGHGNAGTAGAGGTAGTKTFEKTAATGESKAKQITDLENKATNAKARADKDIARANLDTKGAAEATAEAQRLRNQADQMRNAAKNFEKAGSNGNAEASYKAAAEASAKAVEMDKKAQDLNAAAGTLKRNAAIENLVSRVDSAKAEKLANGTGGTNTPKGDTPKTGGDTPKGGSDTPKTGSDAPKGGSDTPKTGSSAPKGSSDTPKTGSDTPKGGSGGDKKGAGIDPGMTPSTPSGSGDRHRGRGVANSGSDSSDTGSAGSGVSVSTGGGSVAASRGTASSGSSSSTTAATTASADTVAAQPADPQAQCLVRINLQDRVLFRDQCTGQWATTTPAVQPVRAEAQQ